MNKILRLLSFKARLLLVFASFLYVISALSELLLISMIIPVINYAISGNFSLAPFTNYLSSVSFLAESKNYLVLFIGCVIIVTIIRIGIIYLSAKISFGVGHSVSVEVYKRFLYKGYERTLSEHSSSVISALSTKLNTVIQNFIYPLVSFLGGMVMLTSAILFLAVFVDLTSSLPVIVGVIFCYAIIIFLFKGKLRLYGKEVAALQIEQVRILQETVGLYRELITSRISNKFIQDYSFVDGRMRNNQSFSVLLGQSPRYLIEGFGVIAIVLGILLSDNINTINSELPLFGAMIVGFVRFLPVINQVYRSWVNLTSNIAAVQDVAELNEEIIGNMSDHYNLGLTGNGAEEDFALRISNGSYFYPGANLASLTNLNCTINIGEVVLVTGESGAGKSTFLNLIMGFLTLHEGIIQIRQRAAGDLISEVPAELFAFIPQLPYLVSDTILSNIVMDEQTSIDYERLNEVLDVTGLSILFRNSDLDLTTYLEENGKSLSGGQRQRIALARTLYKRKPFYIFDEATNSLDLESETSLWKMVLEYLSGSTIFIISHRPEAIPFFTRQVRIDNRTLITL